jgi:rubrerythrin
MVSGTENTGLSDRVYNLITVLNRAAEGGHGYAQYIDDAEKEGDTELAQFFQEVQQQDAERAQKAKSLLGQR